MLAAPAGVVLWTSVTLVAEACNVVNADAVVQTRLTNALLLYYHTYTSHATPVAVALAIASAVVLRLSTEFPLFY